MKREIYQCHPNFVPKNLPLLQRLCKTSSFASDTNQLSLKRTSPIKQKQYEYDQEQKTIDLKKSMDPSLYDFTENVYLKCKTKKSNAIKYLEIQPGCSEVILNYLQNDKDKNRNNQINNQLLYIKNLVSK